MRKSVFAAIFFFALASIKPSLAQNITLGRTAPEPVQVPSRIVKAIDNTHLAKLGGNTHPLAQPRFDQGPLEPSMHLDRMMLVLQRSPEQEQALEAFNARQYEPGSPDFHHWLHASDFGTLYGPSEADMTVIENWLQGLGFTINEVAKGRTWIQFSGNVSMVQNAFHVEMHRYVVNGETHIANDRDPQIPEALSPVVVGIASLHNFFPKPQLVRGKLVKRDRATGKITRLDAQTSAAEPSVAEPSPAGGHIPNDLIKASGSGSSPAPQLTYTDASNDVHEDLTPYDFATIYNYLPLWNASKTGTGVSVAIAAGSDIDIADLTSFRATFGLPATTLNVIHNGTDPGADGGGNQGENTLDVEMVSASAPGATIDLVVSGDTNTTGGFELSDAYIVDNEVAPIMSASYGSCELALGTANNAAFNKIWQQGATEGISIFESSGDQGSAGCTRTDGLTPPQADQVGLQVNGMASSPYVTAVGGTDFTWSFINEPISTYWNASNNADLATAKGYLPEVPWNSTCSNPLLLNIFPGETTTEQLCNDALNSSNFPGLVNVIGGSGGYSHCTTPSGTSASTCSGGYAKPSWQTGLGVPADGKRDLPDVSLFASDGFADGINGSAILFCESSSSPVEKTCDYTNPNYIIYQEIGGTSASSPLLAGIMALVVQKTGTAQGLANPVFYQLAANQVAAGTNCDSSTDTNASTCIFHDISQGTISQVCITNDLNCVTETSGHELGLLSGYPALKGYDEAVGLGSLNVNNLVNSWTSTAGTAAVTFTPTSAVFASTAVGSTSAAQVFTVKNTGTAALSITKVQITGTNSSSFTGGTSCSTTTALAAGASCTVTVYFKPAATGTLTAAVNVTDNVGTQTASLSGTGTSAAGTLSFTPTTLAFASTAVGSTSAAQMVTVKNTGTAAVTFTSDAITGTNASSFLVSTDTCINSLAAGATCTVSVEFKPAAAGSLAASLSIADTATGSPQAIALSGTGTAAAAALSLSPTALTFASTAVGSTSAAQVITVKNTTTAAVTISKIQILGTNPTSFTGGTSCSTTSALAVGASCTVTVAFKPAAAGTLTAAVTLTENIGTQTVNLTGTGVAAGTAVSLSPTSLSFPSTVVGTTSIEQTVTLTNTGSTAITITAIALGGTNPTSFEELTTCGTTLAASSSCSFFIAFKPAAAGSLSATLSVSDSATGSPQQLTLTGTGATAPTLKLSATSVTFPTTKSGTTSSAQAVTLTNSGATAITLNSIALAGANAASFEEVTNCGSSLAASASCTVYLAFKPTAAGTVSATLTLIDNAASSPQSVALSGTGN